MALGGVGEGDGEFLGHAAQDGFVDVLNAVGGAEDADSLGGCGATGCAGGEAVPVRHESGRGCQERVPCGILGKGEM